MFFQIELVWCVALKEIKTILQDMTLAKILMYRMINCSLEKNGQMILWLCRSVVLVSDLRRIRSVGLLTLCFLFKTACFRKMCLFVWTKLVVWNCYLSYKNIHSLCQNVDESYFNLDFLNVCLILTLVLNIKPENNVWWHKF